MTKIDKRMKYGEKTTPIRVPISMIPQIEELIRERALLNTSWVNAVSPPLSAKLAEFMADKAMDSSRLLIDALDAQGGEFKSVADAMRQDLKQARDLYRDAAMGELLVLLNDERKERCKL